MSLCIITGPMCSGKTSRLISNLKDHWNERQGLFKISFDIRDGPGCNLIKSRQGISENAILCESAQDLIKYIDDYDVFGIDEGQFWPGLYEVVKILLNHEKKIIISMLNGDYRAKQFENSKDLFSLVTDDIIFLCARCTTCNKQAHFSKCLDTTIKGELLVSAGEKVFAPTCYKHFKN